MKRGKLNNKILYYDKISDRNTDVFRDNKGDYLYIDKTALVHKMTHGNSKYVFLSIPRRFGKSLLTSTSHSFFEGGKRAI